MRGSRRWTDAEQADREGTTEADGETPESDEEAPESDADAD